MGKKRKVEVAKSFEADPKPIKSEPQSDNSDQEEVEEEVEEEEIEEEEIEEEVEEEVEGGEEEEVNEEDIASILEPFSKEQLIELLRTAASNDPKLVEEIHRVADSDPAHRKLFVHGLGWETTSEKLREFYSQYGEIEECNVVADKITGKSKGYGFLCFKHRKSAQKALKEPQKKIESRMTACQLASAGPVTTIPQPPQQQLVNSSHNPSQENLLRKIYVGNVRSDISSDRLHAFFSKYGEIEEGPLGFDKQTGKPKGYALFIFKTVEGAKKALEEPSKTFEGHLLYCQKATDSHKQKVGSAATVPAKTPSSGGGGGGYNVPGIGAYNAPNGVMASQGSAANPALYGQGYMGGAQQFGQGVAPIQAALAVLAAAGQNPAAFGVSPGAYGSFNPAMAAAMNAGQPAGVPQAMQGYGMVNPGYQNPQANPYQSGPVGQAPAARPHSAMRPYMGR